MSVFLLFIYGFGLCVGYLGLTDNHSLMYMAGQNKDGMVLVWTIIIVSLIGIFDLVLNRYGVRRVPFLKDHRHFLIAILAFCFLAQLFVAYTSIRSNGVLIFYLWPGLFTMVYAVIEARKRKGEKCGYF